MFNSLPNNKILDWPKLKAFADDNLNVAQNLKLVFRRAESTGKRRKMLVHFLHFLHFPQCFRKSFSLGSLTQGLCGKVSNFYQTVLCFRQTLRKKGFENIMGNGENL